MLVHQAMRLFVTCGCFVFAAATTPARVHEARQGGPVLSVPPASLGPGPITRPPQSSSTMSSTPSSELSVPSSSPVSPVSPTPSSPSPSGNSASPSSFTPQPSSSPTYLSINASNMTTCESTFISWNYTGQQGAMYLSITNNDVLQTLVLPGLKARQEDSSPGTLSQQLTVTSTAAGNYTWPSVNVSQGWYEIQGLVLTAPNYRTSSSRFFVANGSDVSCLIGTAPQVSPSPTPASGSTSSGSSNNSTSTIAGSVVGAVVGAALLALVATWMWLRRRRRMYIAGTSMGRRTARWGSLKSNNSDTDPRGGMAAIERTTSRHSQTESTGGMLQGGSGGKVSSPTTPGDSHEDIAMMGEEKLVSPGSPPGMNPFEALNTPVAYDRRVSMYSVQSPTAVADGSRSRGTSVRTSNHSLEQQAQRIRSSMESSIKRRSERLSMPTVPPSGMSRFPHSPNSSQPPEEYPLSPVTATPVNRSISTGAVSNTHRTPRKPVPKYDSSDFRPDVHTDSISTFTAPADSSHSLGTGTGTVANGTPPELSHKPSFGDGRAVHYLIPDMPLPQQD